MTVVLLANVGNRDIRKDGREVRPARPGGKELLDCWPEGASQLSIPLLQPLIDYVWREEGRLDEVVLYATNQPETEMHRDSDTLFFAELCKLMIQRGFSPMPEVRIEKVEDNPSNYDRMLLYFQGNVACQRERHREIPQCYAGVVGGTPAMNLGLLLASIDAFGDRCHPLYLPEGTHETFPLDVARQLREATLRRIAAQQVQDYRFGATASTLRELRIPPLALIHLAEYAGRRLNFDFDGAARVARDGLAVSRGQAHGHLQGAIDEMDHLRAGGDEGALLSELSHNLRVAYTLGAHVDFLGRVVRFEEAAARVAVESRLALSFSGDDGDSQEQRRRAVEADPELAAYLGQKGYGGQPLDYWRANKPVLMAFLDFVVDKRCPPVEAPSLHQVREILRRLEGLNGLRNRSILAHGYVGASAAALSAAYSPGRRKHDILADVATVARTLAPDVADRWHVDEVRAFLMRELGEAGQL